MGQESAVPDRKWVSKQLDGHQNFCNYTLLLTDFFKELNTSRILVTSTIIVSLLKVMLCFIIT